MDTGDVPNAIESGQEANGRRPSWSEYFLDIAYAVSRRSDCERSRVGAVLVKAKRIRSTGYNGAPSGMPGCETCPRRLSGVEPNSSYDTGAGACVAIHAEANALLFASRDDCEGGTLYVTREPCPGCLRLIQGSGIHAVKWPHMGRIRQFILEGE